jgi:hypothetical protein
MSTASRAAQDVDRVGEGEAADRLDQEFAGDGDGLLRGAVEAHLQVVGEAGHPDQRQRRARLRQHARQRDADLRVAEEAVRAAQLVDDAPGAHDQRLGDRRRDGLVGGVRPLRRP